MRIIALVVALGAVVALRAQTSGKYQVTQTYRDPPGRARPLSRRPDGRDAALLAKHGPRSDEPSDLPGGGDLRRGAGRRPRARADGAGIVQADGRRAPLTLSPLDTLEIDRGIIALLLAP